MLYKKPQGVSYTDMCIYIDTHAYKENKTEEERELIYKYVYLISHMLAVKMHLFSDYKYYSDFAIWYTTQIFYRLESPKQYELDDEGNPKLTKITSILNYIKSTIAARKITFEQKEYSQTISKEDCNNTIEYNYSLYDKVNEGLDYLYKAEFDLCLEDCCKSIRKYLSRIPYKGSLWYNIYLSCILTFLNSVTLSNKDIDRLMNLKSTLNIDFTSLYKKETQDPVILYHLDKSMKDYILVLFRQIKHELAMELSQISDVYVGTDSGIYSVMMQELNGYVREDYAE